MPRKINYSPSLKSLAHQFSVVSSEWRTKFNKLARYAPNAVVSLRVNYTKQILELHIQDGNFKMVLNALAVFKRRSNFGMKHKLPKTANSGGYVYKKQSFTSYIRDEEEFKNIVDYILPSVDKVKGKLGRKPRECKVKLLKTPEKTKQKVYY